ncbi:MAG: hypothetical protein H6739_12970 [Alphaproteobacteria bacterium]|nr:hypothetical protein [Alphaproteobacteria bacterium]
MLWTLALACTAKTSEPVDSTPVDSVAPTTPVWMVSGYRSEDVTLVDPESGAFLGVLAPVEGAQSVHPGPDGDLILIAEGRPAVLRWSPETGGDPTAWIEGEPLDAPTAAVIGPDGGVYVADYGANCVLRYDASGAFDRVFVEPAAGTLNGPDNGMVFGPDGDLYVPSYSNHKLLRFDGDSGDFVEEIATRDDGDGLIYPRVVRFWDDRMWVSSWGGDAILRYGLDGSFQDVFFELDGITGFDRDPTSGMVLVVSDRSTAALPVDAATGQAGDALFDAGLEGPVGATFVHWLPDAPFLAP